MNLPRNNSAVFAKSFSDHMAVIRSLELEEPVLLAIAGAFIDALNTRHKILWCGNGGSAADSQHLAAELVGRFRRERPGLCSISLTTDTSIITAIANDYGYEEVFRRQVQALGAPGDVLVGITTSGNSDNVYRALELARAMGMVTIAMTGRSGGRVAHLVDYALRIDSTDTARIQEAHILAGHLWCDWIDMAGLEATDNLAGEHVHG